LESGTLELTDKTLLTGETANKINTRLTINDFIGNLRGKYTVLNLHKQSSTLLMLETDV
jgi:hypothetical protein